MSVVFNHSVRIGSQAVFLPFLLQMRKDVHRVEFHQRKNGLSAFLALSR